MDIIERFCKVYADICDISPDELDKIYADNIVFVDPIATHQGRSEVKRYFSNLLRQSKSCKFDIAHILECRTQDASVTHVANWTMTLVLNQNNKIITLDGTSQICVENDMIVYHKDYYDLGEMVYEHIPVLGFVIRKIKRRLAS